MGQVTETQDPLRAPEPLTGDHQLDDFTSGAPTLDAWLKRKARANQASGASRTYVLCRGQRVVGYYALAAGSVSHDLAPCKLRQNMPDPIPVIVLGRLAIDASEQGNGLGRALLRDAVLRITAAAHEVGIAAILVHALNDRAKAFYLSCGFAETAVEPMTLFARINDVKATMGEA
ncbi:MAG: GNAT family N-acetyltransferase [Rhodobacteraceae bacterium CG17_big_fil_post_rev_8_21_14_2_50_65_11]|nr:MAG: GNAT family N-acetyltransferase [Rhodobacteraceae bacterium CG17_big_fil_post_rev_8_21_14_2_50_65_11]